MRTILVFKIIGQTGKDHCRKIEQQVKYLSFLVKNTIEGEYFFYGLPKRKEGDHIKSQVKYISMNKSMTYEPVVLSMFDSGWVKDQVINDLWLGKAAN